MKLKGIKEGRGKPVKERKKGLSREEEKRLKTLKKKQKAEENRRVPESTQQTITFETIFRDGICRVRKGYYTKMLHFADMNYELLDDREQDEVLKAYGRFINYFDPAISFQIFLFNRHMGEGAVKSRFEIPAVNDGHDDIRDEFSHMLKDLSRKGTNGVEKDRYIIFGIEAESYKEAKESPIMRTLFYEFPNDSMAWEIEDEYMFGDKYLVAPILYADTTQRKVYLPDGANWKCNIDEKVYHGGQKAEIFAPIDKIPVFGKLSGA